MTTVGALHILRFFINRRNKKEMKRNIILLILIALVGVATVTAQGRRGLKLNEVMVVNDSNYVDDYGKCGAWIELFNSTFGPLEISKVFLTNDPKNPKMYPVPIGDVNTRVPKRQHILFWADGKATHGTFHTNFTLDPSHPNWIGIYDTDGLTLIDSVTVPVMSGNMSFARMDDGDGAWEVRDGVEEGKYITPSSNNRIKDTNGKVDMFHENDSHGFSLTIMAMMIVFTALLVLCVCFWIISKIGAKKLSDKKLKSQGVDPTSVKRADRPMGDSGEEIAAIVMALHEHLNAHDNEATILTINKVRRAYSPWSSKIYSLRGLTRK